MPSRKRSLKNNLALTKSAKFLQSEAPLDRNYVARLLARAHGKDAVIEEITLFRNIPELPELKYSYVIFSKEKKVSFLNETDHKDLNHGFFMLIEKHNFVAILNSKSTYPSSIIKERLTAVPYDKLIRLKFRDTLNLQKIRTKAMINSIDGCHNRTFEGSNLQTSLSSLSNHRQLLTAATATTGKQKTSVNFLQAKVSEYGTRDELKEIAEWANLQFDELQAHNNSHRFLDTYAQTADLPSNSRISGIIFHPWELSEYFSGNNGELYLNRFGNFFTNDQIQLIQEIFASPFEIVYDQARDFYKITSDLDNKKRYIGRIAIDGNEINLSLPFLKNIVYEDLDGEVHSFHDIVVHGGHFSLVFNDPTYYYSSGRCVRDADITNRVRRLLEIIVVDEMLDPHVVPLEVADSLDGDGFPDNTTFSVIDNCYRFMEEHLLVCDDGGYKQAEWADFILFKYSQNELPEIVFFHLKASDSIHAGAKPFHVVVAQAIKNMGQLTRNSIDFIDRLDNFWFHGSRKGVNRCRHENLTQIEAQTLITNTVQSPHVKRKVSIVVNYMSKQELLAAINSGQQLLSYQIQQIWLLNDFVSSCFELGLTPEIICPE